MGDITFVEFPQVGDTFQKGEQFGSLESTKAVSELFMPVSGEILAINESLAESPGLVNSDPYGEGWILQVKPSHIEDMESLAGPDAYREMLGGLE
jgi:glycine cleavage system H protein